ncbi:polyprenyl synthetase family protein [Marinicella gelatinilytica]|uniref:polyprenyl synthetase family protein n=1 Tax=Marinicella gelatinilytica TaxID=2996017 RepID=UPI002260DF6D|nr:farnesyl diphosphate synthase [Marinicella gelatinilytica]MCX7545587.1 polyprenyl synthetase family protein [Marinicella gelatinilytica]
MIQYSQLQARIDAFLSHFLKQYRQQSAACQRLENAVRYTLLAGGKRIRPLLVYATADSLQVNLDNADYLAAAIEMIHAYSLIHDDLPAMDNDDLRRGQPTCHIKFDEATAILAGDSLQAMAFDVLSQTPAEAHKVVKLIHNLATACGMNGMAGGQSLDLQAENTAINLDQLQAIHSAKTGALLVACVTMVTSMCDHLNEAQKLAYQKFAEHFGIAFQITDDILDVTSNTEQLGKPAGSDESLHKSTYPSLLGIKQAQQKALLHINAAKDFLNQANANNRALLSLTDYVLVRNH